jgi:hypothetical protein
MDEPASAAPSTLGLLDASDPEQVAEYERHFYRAYAALTDNTLVRLIWDWDDAARRVRTRVPYAEQVIYCQRDDQGRLTAAMAVNLNPDAALQSAGFGFPPPVAHAHSPDPEGRYCELVNFMTTPHQRDQARTTHQTFVRDFCYADLVSRGFGTAYSTCTKRRLRAYQLFGATVLDETVIQGEARYFLHWPIARLLGRRGQSPSDRRNGTADRDASTRV